uniref:Uncharacterized protein n=1 Tax=Myotis myotis TaxID=51298 RepID=A0A7J8ALZ8_MYOMY|nr:hypothetical protein mMyoMyo1_007790 [Myotis myotis]
MEGNAGHEARTGVNLISTWGWGGGDPFQGPALPQPPSPQAWPGSVSRLESRWAFPGWGGWRRVLQALSRVQASTLRVPEGGRHKARGPHRIQDKLPVPTGRARPVPTLKHMRSCPGAVGR